MVKLARIAMIALSLMLGSMVAAPAFSSSYLQCVPFARAESGVQLFGNARDWWAQADGRYARGQSPREGAVMAFAPTRAMPIGHVAVVSRIVSDREVLLSHSNWSPINGRRGQIERNVRALDVSAAGDWSSVRVWYAPMGDLGLRANPISGFIYPDAVPGTGSLAFAPDADGTLARIVASVGN
ncbi:MAG: CHAP domain-containing protein [Pseudomonadota bacterium]